MREVQQATTDDRRWDDVVRRDRSAAGRFVYAVSSTGVYCRPGCPSRLPSRARVVFFARSNEAERAGYRPCLKCKPDTPAALAGPPAAILEACRAIDQAESPPKLRELAAAAGLNPYHFHRLFKQVVGVTPMAYAAARRAHRVQGALMGGETVTEAFYAAGFASSSRFYEGAVGLLGMAPVAYRDGAPGIRIQFAVARSYLGWVLVAATDRGVCAIELGDSPAALRESLGARFPRAELREGEPGFAACVAKVVALVQAPARGFGLPLDVQGTAFQRRVWRELQAIPAGSTATYSEIAGRIGSPGAGRAVARACAANPVAVAVPCHRVVRGDGKMGGYRWGVERKRKLLKREASR